MAQGQSPIFGLRFPKPRDTPNVPRDIRNLAEDVENLAAGSLLPVFASGSYTPVLEAGTNPNLGSTGEADGFWHRSGTWVTGWARFLFDGTGVDGGSGRYIVSLPFSADPDAIETSSSPGVASVAGSGVLQQTGGTSYILSVAQFSTDFVWMIVDDGSPAQVSESNPFSIGDGDRIGITFGYAADPSGI